MYIKLYNCLSNLTYIKCFLLFSKKGVVKEVNLQISGYQLRRIELRK